MKISTILKASFCVLGLVGASNFLASPAKADQASARAAVSITNPSSFTQSVSGEVLLPDGLYFEGYAATATTAGSTLDVTPTLNDAVAATATAAATPVSIKSLSFDAGPVVAVSTVGGGADISDVVVAILQSTNSSLGTATTGTDIAVKAASIDDAAAIIKAAAGINGLE